jgi:hypothetical protein
MTSYDACFRTGLHSTTREFDPDTTEYAFRLARRITDEHSDSLGLDDYEDDPLYVELGDDAIRERAAAVDAAKGGVQ